jgi:hypothetical protein
VHAENMRSAAYAVSGILLTVSAIFAMILAQ